MLSTVNDRGWKETLFQVMLIITGIKSVTQLYVLPLMRPE